MMMLAVLDAIRETTIYFESVLDEAQKKFIYDLDRDVDYEEFCQVSFWPSLSSKNKFYNNPDYSHSDSQAYAESMTRFFANESKTEQFYAKENPNVQLKGEADTWLNHTLSGMGNEEYLHENALEKAYNKALQGLCGVLLKIDILLKKDLDVKRCEKFIKEKSGSFTMKKDRVEEISSNYKKWKNSLILNIPKEKFEEKRAEIIHDYLQGTFFSYQECSYGSSKINTLLEESPYKKYAGSQTPANAIAYAKLRMFVGCENGNIVDVNYEALGQYVCMHHCEISEEEIDDFFALMTQIRLIQNDMGCCSSEGVSDIIKNYIQDIRAIVKEDLKERYDIFWNRVMEDERFVRLFKETAPQGFHGKYNKKLFCNIIGFLSGEDFFTMDNQNIDRNYTKKMSNQTAVHFLNNCMPGRDGQTATSQTVLTTDLVNILRGYLVAE